MRIILIGAVLLSFISLQAQDTTFLDTLPFGEITDDFGTPKRNQSFAYSDFNINGKVYNRGLGVNAPSRLTIDVDNNFNRFYAEIGIDSAAFHYHTPEGRKVLEQGRAFNSVPGYIYDGTNQFDFTQGGSVIFRIWGDGNEIYNSGIVTKYDTALKVNLNISGIHDLVLEVTNGNDGSFSDFANWCNAFFLTDHQEVDTPTIVHHPDRIIVSHAGFHPQSVKKAFRTGISGADFHLIRSSTGEKVFSGNLVPANGKDLGTYSIADFTSFKETGRYFVSTDSFRSETFTIHPDVYSQILEKHLFYVSQQRSGHPETGWNPGQHLDDAIREDNQERLPLYAGWYDANDVRKNALGTTYILDALAEIALTNKNFMSAAVTQEIKWGNLFLHNFQSAEGFIFTSIGFGEYMKSDNRWTDNKKDTDDDRIVVTEPAPAEDQYRFITGQLKSSLVFKDSLPEYANKCKNAALACWNWLSHDATRKTTAELSQMTEAAIYLYSVTDERSYKIKASEGITELLSREVYLPEVPLVIYRSGNERREIYSNSGVLPSLHLYLKQFPDGNHSKDVTGAIERFAENFVSHNEKNAFSILPWMLSENFNTGRTLGPYHYRYFLHVGMNGNLGTRGYEMLLANQSIPSNVFMETAHASVEWIFGANPFNASTVFGIGQNQPALFKAGSDYFAPPHTPRITGGIMTGIGADANDRPALYPGYWWTTEYWAPTVAKVLLMMNQMDLHYRLQ